MPWSVIMFTAVPRSPAIRTTGPCELPPDTEQEENVIRGDVCITHVLMWPTAQVEEHWSGFPVTYEGIGHQAYCIGYDLSPTADKGWRRAADSDWRPYNCFVTG